MSVANNGLKISQIVDMVFTGEYKQVLAAGLPTDNMSGYLGLKSHLLDVSLTDYFYISSKSKLSSEVLSYYT